MLVSGSLMEIAERSDEHLAAEAAREGSDGPAFVALVDRFRQRYPTCGVVVLASISEGRPVVIAGVTEDLVQRGLHAGELVKHIASYLGGSGGGRPTLAQAGGKDASRLEEALGSVYDWVTANLHE